MFVCRNNSNLSSTGVVRLSNRNISVTSRSSSSNHSTSSVLSCAITAINSLWRRAATRTGRTRGIILLAEPHNAMCELSGCWLKHDRGYTSYMCAATALTVLMDSMHCTVSIGRLRENVEVQLDSMTVLGGKQNWKKQFHHPQQQPSCNYLSVSAELLRQEACRKKNSLVLGNIPYQYTWQSV